MKELLEQVSPRPPSLGLSFHNLEIRVIIPKFEDHFSSLFPFISRDFLEVSLCWEGRREIAPICQWVDTKR